MRTTPPPAAGARRLTEIDALRGIAAMLVVLFHYTTRYQELYGHTTPAMLSLPWGYLGVNLFFMISGFVIFMTLERTRAPADFIVSRFSRLYPAYWAAVALTFGVTHWLGLPDKVVPLSTGLLNLTMIQSLFGVHPVDGVYWTLEIELIFYAWALLAFRLRLLGKVHLLLAALIVLRLVYFGAAALFHVDLPWIVSRYLILGAIPWFAAGIMVYRLAHDGPTPRRDWATALLAAAVLGIVDGAGMALLCAALFALLYGAARGRLPLLGHRVLVFGGAISYTLYLVHENIGWSVMRQLEQAGVDANAAIGLTLALALGLATLLTRYLELPAMGAIRRWYKRRQQVVVAVPEQQR